MRGAPGGMFPASVIMKCSAFSRSPWSYSKFISGTAADRRGTSGFAISTNAFADSSRLPRQSRSEPVELPLPDPPRPGRNAQELRRAFGFGTPAGLSAGTIPGRAEDSVQSADRGLPEPPAADRRRGLARLS